VICALIVTTGVAACGDQRNHSGQQSATRSSATAAGQVADHNDRDLIFAHAMLAHNAQATSLATLAVTHSKNEHVTALASEIAAAENPERQAFTAWLLQWGDDPHVDPSMPLNNPGMADVATVDQLQSLSGPDFDELWLATMVTHHQGAIDIAQREMAEGRNVDAMAMARSVISARQAELDKMKQMHG
jgi:uncharacterized protein (DUF305 family)